MTRCTRCLYPSDVPSIQFDAAGVCTYCHIHDNLERDYPVGAAGEEKLREMADQIRRESRRKPYDVVVGVSGGCDSSYMLYYTKEILKLRPLAVHFDNTWNSTVATENIHNVLRNLDVDLYTYVVDNEEYDDIYRSFLKAGVPDIEAPTDIGLAAVLYRGAQQHGIKYIFEGHSFRTEGISPLGWLYMDGKYITTIQRLYGTRKLSTYPNMKFWSFLRWTTVAGIKKLRPMYYMDYHKQTAMELLTSQLGWKWYGGHHLENRFTAFYHSYFLPQRFGIDGRLLGYSALTRSGQMTREEGLRLVERPQEYDPEIIELVKKRLRFTDNEFDQLMTMPRHHYSEFSTYKQTFERLEPFFRILARFDRVPKSFYMKYCFPDRVRPTWLETGAPEAVVRATAAD